MLSDRSLALYKSRTYGSVTSDKPFMRHEYSTPIRGTTSRSLTGSFGRLHSVPSFDRLNTLDTPQTSYSRNLFSRPGSNLELSKRLNETSSLKSSCSDLSSLSFSIGQRSPALQRLRDSSLNRYESAGSNSGCESPSSPRYTRSIYASGRSSPRQVLSAPLSKESSSSPIMERRDALMESLNKMTASGHPPSPILTPRSRPSRPNYSAARQQWAPTRPSYQPSYDTYRPRVRERPIISSMTPHVASRQSIRSETIKYSTGSVERGESLNEISRNRNVIMFRECNIGLPAAARRSSITWDLPSTPVPLISALITSVAVVLVEEKLSEPFPRIDDDQEICKEASAEETYTAPAPAPAPAPASAPVLAPISTLSPEPAPTQVKAPVSVPSDALASDPAPQSLAPGKVRARAPLKQAAKSMETAPVVVQKKTTVKTVTSDKVLSLTAVKLMVKTITPVPTSGNIPAKTPAPEVTERKVTATVKTPASGLTTVNTSTSAPVKNSVNTISNTVTLLEAPPPVRGLVPVTKSVGPSDKIPVPVSPSVNNATQVPTPVTAKARIPVTVKNTEKVGAPVQVSVKPTTPVITPTPVPVAVPVFVPPSVNPSLETPVSTLNTTKGEVTAPAPVKVQIPGRTQVKPTLIIPVPAPTAAPTAAFVPAPTAAPTAAPVPAPVPVSASISPPTNTAKQATAKSPSIRPVPVSPPVNAAKQAVVKTPPAASAAAPASAPAPAPISPPVNTTKKPIIKPSDKTTVPVPAPVSPPVNATKQKIVKPSTQVSVLAPAPAPALAPTLISPLVKPSAPVFTTEPAKPSTPVVAKVSAQAPVSPPASIAATVKPRGLRGPEVPVKKPIPELYQAKETKSDTHSSSIISEECVTKRDVHSVDKQTSIKIETKNLEKKETQKESVKSLEVESKTNGRDLEDEAEIKVNQGRNRRREQLKSPVRAKVEIKPQESTVIERARESNLSSNSSSISSSRSNSNSNSAQDSAQDSLQECHDLWKAKAKEAVEVTDAPQEGKPILANKVIKRSSTKPDVNGCPPKAVKVKRKVSQEATAKVGVELQSNGNKETPSSLSSPPTETTTKVAPKATPSPPTVPSVTPEGKEGRGTVSVVKPIEPEAPQPRKRIRFRKYALNDFLLLNVLGRGSFGKVFLAELKHHQMYFAIKCLKKHSVIEDDDVESTMIERRVLALGCVHPFICRLFCTFQTPEYLCFVMEYLCGGDLMFHVQKNGKFSEDRAKFYASEIVCALKFLHKKAIIYRDLKLDNILLDVEGHIRLVDFGMCQCKVYREECLPSNFCGTPEYMAPEIIKGMQYNQSVDWWSFGVLLYEMIVGKSPFNGTDEDELLWNVCYETVHYPKYLTENCKSILTLLMEKAPEKRLGCAAGDVAYHPFFASVEWGLVEKLKVTPPFRPELTSSRDISNFDRVFTSAEPNLTPPDEDDLEEDSDHDLFKGFSYTNPNMTD